MRSVRGTRKEGSNIGVVKQQNVVASFKNCILVIRTVFLSLWCVRTDKVVLSEPEGARHSQYRYR